MDQLTKWPKKTEEFPRACDSTRAKVDWDAWRSALASCIILPCIEYMYPICWDYYNLLGTRDIQTTHRVHGRSRSTYQCKDTLWSPHDAPPRAECVFFLGSGRHAHVVIKRLPPQRHMDWQIFGGRCGGTRRYWTSTRGTQMRGPLHLWQFRVGYRLGIMKRKKGQGQAH